MKVFVLTALLLGGCATATGGSDGKAPAGAVAEGVCDAAKVTPLFGKALSSEVEAQARRLSGAERTRVLRPGDAATMDYRSDRLNLILDAQDRLTGANCG